MIEAVGDVEISRQFTIYSATNIVNGKSYIGQTVKTLGRRKTEHKLAAKNGSSTYFHNAIRKYGIDNFVFKPVCLCESKELADKKECELIKFTKAPRGYNLTDGGEGASGNKPSEKTRKKLSQKSIGNQRALGYKHSDVAKEKIGKASIGNTHNLGRIPSKETREKMSKAQKGRKHIVETKEKIRKARKGKKQTAETKEKLRQAGMGNTNARKKYIGVHT